MPQPQVDPWLSGMVLLLAAASLATWGMLIARRRRSGSFLPYAPRRPVPWGAEATVLSLIFVTMAILSSLMRETPADQSATESAIELTERVASGALMQSSFVIVFFAAVALMSGAKRADLGFPEFVAGVIHDGKIGVVGWLAVLIPVYGLQAVLVHLLGEHTSHPLIRMVEKQPSPAFFVLAFGMAVIGAPICEEIAFRLLLQGWLEKWEDERLGWRTPATAEAAVAAEILPLPLGEGRGEGELASAPPLDFPASGAIAAIEESAQQSTPPDRGVAGLPYGWSPILASSFVFAMAHFGIGPDPFPIFLLAIVLGYMYQRTHRILPGIVTHALFNLLTLIALWRLAHGEAP